MSVISKLLLPLVPRPKFPRSPEGQASPVESPVWWVYRLSYRLAAETAGFVYQSADASYVFKVGTAKLKRYHDGDFDLPWVYDDRVAVEYRAMLERSRSNFMRLVVSNAAERSRPIGLRFPDDLDSTDIESWDIWQRNDMDSWFATAVETALGQRRAYWSVWWGDGDESARITLEDPQQAIVEYAPGDRRRRAAGLKLWVDDWTGETFANLFLPDAIHRFRWGKPDRGVGPEGWFERSPAERNPLGVVPLVPMVNRPGLDHFGVSDIEDALPVQDRINSTLFNRAVAEHLAAFRQKWATGIEIPEEDGVAIETYKAAIDKLWVSPDTGTRFGQFEATDLSNYHRTIEQDLEHLSIMTRTPRHVFMHQGQAPSGDAMKSDEAGLIAKVRGQWAGFTPAVREVLTLARRIDGLDTPMGSEIVWADPEFQTYAQLVDGTTKLVEARIASLRWAREKVGMTPAMIRRVESELLQDDILGLDDPAFTMVSETAVDDG